MNGNLKVASLVVAGLLAVSAIATAWAAASTAHSKPGVDFSNRSPVIELKDVLSPYGAPAGAKADLSRWYMVTAVNEAVRPVTRVLVAEDPPDASLSFFPRRARPEILQLAASDSAVVVERARAFARHAYQVTIPPATSVSLAVRVAYSDDPPSMLAWTQAALVEHNRQVAIFLAGVAGLIATAVVIMAGVAIVTAHPAPYWAALTLTLLFLTRLQSAGVFDAGWFTYIGGPYGLSAMLSGLALAAALRLTDLVAPFSDLWRAVGPWVNRVLFALAGLSLLAFVGVPGATVLLQAVVLFGTAATAAYLVRRGLNGCRAARVLAPAATVFALVAAASAAAMLGAFRDNPAASGAIAGFVGAGAVLLALAVAAGEGIAILPIAAQQVRSAAAKKATEEGNLFDNRGPVEDRSDVPGTSAADGNALLAVEASRQGIFDLNFDTDTLQLSGETVSVESTGASIPHEKWISRIHPKDRQVYTEALTSCRGEPGLAFRMEFRTRQEDGRWRWLELRDTILGERPKPGHRCLGLIVDITGRKSSEDGSRDRSARDGRPEFGKRGTIPGNVEHIEES